MKAKPPKQRSASKRGTNRHNVVNLEAIPNVGPSIAADLRLIGFKSPADLPGSDPFAMYDALCRKTGQSQDPCVIDAFISAVRYMEGAPKKPWWKYTTERKQELAARQSEVR